MRGFLYTPAETRAAWPDMFQRASEGLHADFACLSEGIAQESEVDMERDFVCNILRSIELAKKSRT